jgi:hypothetical protein
LAPEVPKRGSLTATDSCFYAVEYPRDSRHPEQSTMGTDVVDSTANIPKRRYIPLILTR